ncbi:MAG: ATP-grasp domain-containing protein [Planctomycetes bacterium]|nr:ATP-grasp domain-containing protein [Planctomycetota bacterium]
MDRGAIGIARLGAVDDYAGVFAAWRQRGVEFINTPELAAAADDLPTWYPMLADLTPLTKCWDVLPEAAEIEASFGWPVFIKGVRQTSRHNARLAVASSRGDYEVLREGWLADPILAPQRAAVRSFVSLRRVRDSQHSEELPRCFEFRTIWLRGKMVGAGRYWLDAPAYHWTPEEQHAACSVAREAAGRLATPFLCIDVAQTSDRSWIVIEVNDAQRSGYAGVPRIELWRNILALFRNDSGA